jgi:hypothetical protein
MSRTATTTIDVPPLSILARAALETINESDRSVELVFSTGAPVTRYDWMKDTRYLEVLEISPKAIRTERLNTAPLLDAHSAWSITDQIGTVVANTFRIENGQAIVRVRFSRRAAVDPIWQDVKDRILQNVSVGYRVHKFEEDASNPAAMPVRTATDWEPFEVSMVPMPADTGARVRDGRDVATNQCVLTRKENAVQNENRSETLAEDPIAAGLRILPANPAPAGGAPANTEPTAADRAVAVERERVTGIMRACSVGRMTPEFQARLIGDGVSLVDAQARVFAELEARGGQREGPQPGAGAAVRVGEDPFVHVRAGIEAALLHRIAPQYFKTLDDRARQYRGLSLLDTARVFLNAKGVRTTELGKMELAAVALGLSQRGGMHTTSDFPFLLADVANKTLRAAYQEAPQTFQAIGRRVTLPDFKPVYRVQIGDAPALLEVQEHGEFKRGTIGEGRETYQLATYGRVFAITRKALVNDDADAFGRVPTLFGRAARNLESDLAWQQITTNPDMGDGFPLFSAEHGNLAGAGGDVISVDSLGAARGSMRRQTSLDGQLINIGPTFLIVPTFLETKAEAIVTPIVPNSVLTVNPFTGKLTVIAEPRLDAEPLAWYLAASPNQIDILEYGFLEGEDGPTVETRVGFDVDGIEVKCREDFAAKAIDWRGLFKNPGDQES